MIMTVDEVVLRSQLRSPASDVAGFKRMIPGDTSPKATDLLIIPESREEVWAPAWHMRTSYIHALGCYLIDDVLVARRGEMFAGDIPIFQRDVVVPYIEDYLLPLSEARPQHATELSIDEATLVAFDRGYATYGHFLLDLLPRFYIFERTFGLRSAECWILLPSDLPEWGRDILNELFPTLSSRFKFVDLWSTLVKLRRAVIPTQCHDYYRFHPFAKVIFDEIYRKSGATTAHLASNGRVFISRRRLLSSSRETAEIDEIEEYARSRGMIVLSPERYSWPEQLAHFKAARVIIGEYGSALHNSVFAEDGVFTVSLGRLQFLQSWLGALNKQRIGYLLPLSTEEHDGKKRYQFGIDRARKAIDSVLQMADR